ncbi:MAG TPA: TonB-dependent receptor, partial [Flavisolibacter sp.]|nr:TonB-dependent receptor [Flavisolibacter sp.]
NSDFYTGAFPAEFGNATSGVFDLNLRTGNKDKREHSLMIGGMGVELATEGYFKKGHEASYLINYRYSTLSLMKSFLKGLGGVLPDYQDLSFKLNFPTKHLGTFAVFGLGGINQALKDPEKDSAKWEGDEPNYVINEKGKTGVVGISHQVFINSHSYIRTVLAASATYTKMAVDTLNPHTNYSQHRVGESRNLDEAYRVTVSYTNKLNAAHSIKAGVIASRLGFDFYTLNYDDADAIWRSVLNGKGRAEYYQGYAQWKYRMMKGLTLNAGWHASFFTLNNTYSMEPRAALTWQAGHNQAITVAAGLHAKPEHLSTYLLNYNNPGTGFQYPNKNLDLTKAAHFIAGYDKGFKNGFRFKTEFYYQHLYDVPVEKKTDGYFSILNASSINDLRNIDTLVSRGTGKNYGVDLTLEKPFNRNYYFLVTTSLYQSRYTNYSGKEFNARYSRNYQVNMVGGKEWKNPAGRIWGVNAKVLTSGGLKQSPIDIETSRARGKVVYITNRYYTQTQPLYYRLDAGVSYKINKRKLTHTFLFDIQNLINHQNLFASYFNTREGAIKNLYQMGFFPIINYRVEF